MDCVNNILQFYGFLIFCLCVAASSPSFCSHARTASPSLPPCASSAFWIPISSAISLFDLYLRRNKHSSGLVLLSFSHFCHFFFFLLFQYFAHLSTSWLHSVPTASANKEERRISLKGIIRSVSIPKKGAFPLAVLSTLPLYIKHNNGGTIMRTEFPQKKRSFPNHSKPGFVLYYYCGYRRLVLPRAVKPTHFPTISGDIIFSLLCFFDCVSSYCGEGMFIWIWRVFLEWKRIEPG